MRLFLTLALFVCFTEKSSASEHDEGCDTVYPSTKLSEALNGAEGSFADLDVTGFSNSMQETLLFVLPCLEEPISVAAAAQLHRMMALRAYIERRDDLTTPSLLASRLLEPEFVLPNALFPEGHEFRDRYDALTVDVDSPRLKLKKPRSGTVVADGTAASSVSDVASSVIQFKTEEGAIAWTQYRIPGEPVRAYPSRPVVRTSLLAHAGAQLAMSATFFAVSRSARAKFLDEDGDYTLEELEHLQGQANTFSSVALGSAALAGASVGVSLVLWQK